MTRLRSRKGFTLIELLIVVVIIGILATVLITRFSGAKEGAYLAKVNSVAQQVSMAALAYQAQSAAGTIPLTIANLQSISAEIASGGGVTITVPADATANWVISHSKSAKTATVHATTGAVTSAAVVP